VPFPLSTVTQRRPMSKSKPTTIADVDPSHLISEGVLTRFLGWNVELIDRYLTHAYSDGEGGRLERHFRADRVATVTRQQNLQPSLDLERDRLSQCAK
jgi:hypothetical protein